MESKTVLLRNTKDGYVTAKCTGLSSSEAQDHRKLSFHVDILDVTNDVFGMMMKVTHDIISRDAGLGKVDRITEYVFPSGILTHRQGADSAVTQEVTSGIWKWNPTRMSHDHTLDEKRAMLLRPIVQNVALDIGDNSIDAIRVIKEWYDATIAWENDIRARRHAK